MDTIDQISEEWARQRPDIDVEPIEAWGRLKRTAGLLERALMRAIDDAGITMAEFELVAVLVRAGPPFEMRPTELTRTLTITAGAVTARLTSLATANLITRREDPNDGRVQLVTLTAKGLYVFGPAFDRIRAECAVILDQLSPDDRQNLHSSLRQLMNVLESRPSVREQDNPGFPE